MFRKLRLKLMLVNLSVIVVLFLLLITGAYFFVRGQMIEGGDHMMHRMSRDLTRGAVIQFPPEPPPGNDHDNNGPPRPMIFFIKTTQQVMLSKLHHLYL